MGCRAWLLRYGPVRDTCWLAQEVGGRLPMLDPGSSTDFRASKYIKGVLGHSTLDYLSITNTDRDHMSGMKELSDADILTTRRDGWIKIDVHPNSMFYTTAEYQG